MTYKITITKDCDNEYRVPGPDGTEAQAYYTDDREDARGTALQVLGSDVVITWRTVNEHPIKGGVRVVGTDRRYRHNRSA